MSEPLLLLDEQLRVMMINNAAIYYYSIGDRQIRNQPCHIALRGEHLSCEECDIPVKINESKQLTFERKGLFDPNHTEQVAMNRSVASD